MKKLFSIILSVAMIIFTIVSNTKKHQKKGGASA